MIGQLVELAHISEDQSAFNVIQSESCVNHLGALCKMARDSRGTCPVSQIHGQGTNVVMLYGKLENIINQLCLCLWPFGLEPNIGCAVRL